jgi:cytochrome c oxidase cbb3-type subunit III
MMPIYHAARVAPDSEAGLRYHAAMRFLVVLIMASLLVAAVFAADGHAARQLLRADPDALTADAMLLRFAVGRGRPLFEARCAVCHGASGSGDPDRGVPNLTDDDWLYGTGRAAEIEKVIDYGIRSRNPKAWNLAIMPAYARPQPNPADKNIQPLSPLEIHDVIEFLMHRQGRQADATAASRGAAVFTGHGGCYDCHSLDAKGDSAIGAPNLSDATTLYGDGSRDALYMSIAYGRQGVCPAWINRASAASIRELALYVYSISHPGAIRNGY